VASVLPVWLLLEPCDYLSTYVKLGTIGEGMAVERVLLSKLERTRTCCR